MSRNVAHNTGWLTHSRAQFEGRLAGLLGSFRKLNLPAEVTDRFHVMGGECNYLLRVTPEDKRLEFVPDEVGYSTVARVFAFTQHTHTHTQTCAHGKPMSGEVKKCAFFSLFLFAELRAELRKHGMLVQAIGTAHAPFV
eukprot:155710-Pelagomonas_calceolata.AAC.3